MKNKKMKLKISIFLMGVFILVSIITFPLYVFYGPFKDVRDMVVGLSMSTTHYQFVAKMFLSDKEIQDILDSANIQNNVTKDISVSKEAVAAIAPIEVDTTDSDIETIEVTTNKFNGTAIIIKDPTRVKIGYSKKLGEVGETVSSMAKRYGAIVAINGGGYKDVSNVGYSGGNGGVPIGILISEGRILSPSKSTEYSKVESSVFAIDSSGKAFVGEASAQDLVDSGYIEAISFSPTLVVNGKPYISETTLHGINPRTAIGQREDGSIIMLVIDGRRGLKFGATLEQVQEVMIRLGAINAMCLDGGGSSVMYYNGEVINNPSNLTGERCVPDIIYVK